MEDLREVGQKAIESVGNLGASNAGDLVLGIGEIIEELREQPELYKEKLDHLEGLFREFAFGEGYELRNDRTEEPEDEGSFSTIGALSGYVFSNPGSNPIHVSGVLPPSASNGSVAKTSPIKSSSEEDDILLDEEKIDANGINEFTRRETFGEKLKPEKGYEHKWWKTKA